MVRSGPPLRRWWMLWLVVTACATAPRSAMRSVPLPSPRIAHTLERLRAKVHADPERAAAHLHLGGTLARLTLQGHLQFRDAAEHHLERAYRLDPEARTAASMLARFLNLRLVEFDFDKVALQVELYEALVGRDDHASEAERFEAACFLEAVRAAADRADHRPLRAVRRVQALERQLEARLREHPDEIETHAMAGNYALTFASLLPGRKAARRDRAIEHLAVQQAHWSAMRPTAQGIGIAPGTRSVFSFWLAEALLSKGDSEAARPHYQRVVALAEAPDPSRPTRELAELARRRLADDPAGRGQSVPMPGWPHGVTACVACHAETASILP